MAKRLFSVCCLLALLFSLPSARGEMQLERREGEAFFPSEAEWTYHFTYAYPHLKGEDYASAAINDTYEMALDEMLQLVLPMFAHEEEMLFDGKNEVKHDFAVTCNNGVYLSILQYRSQTKGEEGVQLSLEAQVFDVAGEYLGEMLTLRGVVMVGDSSAQLAAAVTPVLYEEFKRLQAEGVCRPEITEEEFCWEFAATRDYYADAEGNAVFFFLPMLLTEPSFDVPVFPFTREQLRELAAALPEDWEE